MEEILKYLPEESMAKVTVKRSIKVVDLINVFVIWGADRQEMLFSYMVGYFTCGL
jgi:hypothetical protein